MTCGKAKPMAMADPPTIRVTLLRMLAKVGGDESSRRSSKANRRPPKTPLLRNAVANPNHMPDAMRLTSWAAVLLSLRTPLAKNRWPRNERNANVLSEYGADKNRPAGDKMCSKAAMNDSLLFPQITRPSWKSTRTDRRWDV